MVEGAKSNNHSEADGADGEAKCAEVEADGRRIGDY